MSNDPPGPSDGFDSTQETIHHQYDWTSTSPVTAVIETVAVAINQAPTNMVALYPHVDPDGLEGLLTQGPHSFADAGLQISFVYMDCEITVTAHGEIIVKSKQEPA